MKLSLFPLPRHPARRNWVSCCSASRRHEMFGFPNHTSAFSNNSHPRTQHVPVVESETCLDGAKTKKKKVKLVLPVSPALI